MNSFWRSEHSAGSPPVPCSEALDIFYCADTLSLDLESFREVFVTVCTTSKNSSDQVTRRQKIQAFSHARQQMSLGS